MSISNSSPSFGSCYSPREIAEAACVPEGHVLAALGGASRYVAHAEAVQIGRALRQVQVLRAARGEAPAALLFNIFTSGHAQPHSTGLPLAVSSTLHAGLFLFTVFMTTFGLTPTGATAENIRSEAMPLVFVALPGPGGGGGGGGLQQKAPPAQAEREGRHSMTSPLPIRRPPKPIEIVPDPPEPQPEPLKAERLPIVLAPVMPLPADLQTHAGVLEQTTTRNDSRGSGRGGGTGAGAGTGLGQGEGEGIGPGSGGGTGGGVFRPGSGIQAPRLLREVKPDYTEDARVRQLTGEVILEIVVRRDGSVGDLKIVRGLGGGLNDRAVAAVRQWRFSPALRQGTPVDVIVEVAVEFKLR